MKILYAEDDPEQAALRASEQSFRYLFANNPHPMWVYDLETLAFLEVNDTAILDYGYSRDEFLQMTIADIRPAEDVSPLMELIKKERPVLRNSGEWRHCLKDGSIIDVEIVSHLLEYNGRKASLVVVNNITFRKQAEEALLASEKNLQEAQRLAHLGSWHWTAATDTVTWSHELYHINGRDPNLPAPSFAEMSACYTPESWQRLSAAVAQAMQAGESYQLDLEIVRPDSSTRHTSARGEVELDVSGKVVGLHGTVYDTTERKQAEAELVRLREAVNTSGEVIFLTNRDGLITFVNPEFTQLYGFTAAEVVGKVTPRILKSGLLKAEEYTYFWQTLLNKQVMKGEYSNKTKDGRLLTVEGSASPIFNEQQDIVGFLAIQRDITARKQAEGEIHQRAEELDALQKTVLDITSAQNLPGLLESIVERACRLVGAPGGTLFLNDPVKKELLCVVSYHTPHNYVGVVLKHGVGLAGKVAQSGQPMNIQDYQKWSGRAAKFEEEKPFSAVLGVPLLWGGQVNGVIDLLQFEDGKIFTQSDQELLNLFAGHAAISIENTHMLEDVLARNEEVRTLSLRLAEAEENERRRIARELHDQVGQSLSALSINLNIMNSQIPEYLPGFKRRLEDSLLLIDQTTDHIRSLMSELRPAVLDDYGLKAALDWAAGSVASRTNLKLLVEGECNRFSGRVEIALFRIAQEALANISRHAHAHTVKILLTQTGPDFCMTIQDDGIGFDQAATVATERSGWGLRLMQERAESIGGSLQVDSAPGKGTSITVTRHDPNPAG